MLMREPQPEQSGPPMGLMYNGIKTPEESVVAVEVAARAICILCILP